MPRTPSRWSRFRWWLGRHFCEVDERQIVVELASLRLQTAQHRNLIQDHASSLNRAMAEHLECLAVQKLMREQLDLLKQEREILTRTLWETQHKDGTDASSWHEQERRKGKGSA